MKIVTIGDISKQIRGVTYEKSDASSEPLPGFLPILRAGNIVDGEIDLDDLVYIPKNKINPNQYLRKGDILIAASSGSLSVVGKAARVRQDYEAGFGAFCKVLRPSEKVYPPYFANYFQTQSYRHIVSNLAAGANINNLRNEHLDNLEIPLPPLAEQQRIATILDKADELRTKRRAALAKLDTLLQATFLHMFGEQHENRLVTVEKVASQRKYALSSGPFGSSLTSEHYTNDGVLVLRGLNVSSGELDLTDVKFVSEEKAKTLIRSEVRPKDIVIVAVGASGQAFQIPEALPRAIMSQNFNKITPDISIVDPTYLEFALNSLYVQRQFHREITDTVRTFLSLTKIKQVKVSLPPLAQQKEFAGIVDHINRSKINQQNTSLEKLNNLFHTLQQRAFKGEL